MKIIQFFNIHFNFTQIKAMILGAFCLAAEPGFAGVRACALHCFTLVSTRSTSVKQRLSAPLQSLAQARSCALAHTIIKSL